MKELSIEEKARRYDEAIKRLEDINTGKCKATFIFTEGLFEYIFPELKESEDEKIRKAIIEFFELQDDNTTYSFIPKKDVLAWLEKQKEFVSTGFKDVWEAMDCEKLTAPLERFSKDAIMRLCHAWYDKGIELERKKCLEKQGEQKPVWSDEDETTINNLVWALSADHLKDREEFCEWLNALNDRMKKKRTN